MKVALVTYFFYPTINPRAFRAFELVKQICKEGHQLDLYIPDLGYNYESLKKEYPNLKIILIEPGFYLNRKECILTHSNEKKGVEADVQDETSQRQSISKRFKTGIIKLFYPGGFNFEFTFTCSKALRKEKGNYDKLISIALPLCSHAAVWRASIWSRKFAKVKIADYGDPYSYNQNISPPLLHKWLERRILKKFDYIIVPNEKMVQSFTKFKKLDKIQIIPQALDFDQFSTSQELLSAHNPIPHMAFAGNFYEEIRNPKELFEYLISYEGAFKLTLYINTSEPANLKVINKYKPILGDKLEVNEFLPRVECIYKLSQCDFNINIQNTTEEQTPSKLIDYVLSGRPIYSYKPGTFDEGQFKKFIQGDYSEDLSKTIDKSSFDIKRAIKKILDLN